MLSLANENVACSAHGNVAYDRDISCPTMQLRVVNPDEDSSIRSIDSHGKGKVSRDTKSNKEVSSDVSSFTSANSSAGHSKFNAFDAVDSDEEEVFNPPNSVAFATLKPNLQASLLDVFRDRHARRLAKIAKGKVDDTTTVENSMMTDWFGRVLKENSAAERKASRNTRGFDKPLPQISNVSTPQPRQESLANEIAENTDRDNYNKPSAQGSYDVVPMAHWRKVSTQLGLDNENSKEPNDDDTIAHENQQNARHVRHGRSFRQLVASLLTSSSSSRSRSASRGRTGNMAPRRSSSARRERSISSAAHGRQRDGASYGDEFSEEHERNMSTSSSQRGCGGQESLAGWPCDEPGFRGATSSKKSMTFRGRLENYN